MNWVKGFALVTCLAMPLSAIAASDASADPAADAKAMPAPAKDSAMKSPAKPNQAALQAMRDKCSAEADAKKLLKKFGKSEERKTFRRDCLRKMGVAVP